ncbi:hypothetical protein QJQ45_025871 [Haematococcus lacustris]|nr:hypothetical protein QJQ45_025871 [Haematococcus lacustris]
MGAGQLPHIGRGIAEVREFVFDPDTQIGVGIDPGVTQAVSAASGVWDPATGQLKADQLRRWKLTKGEVKHASGLNNARRDTERWLAPIRPHLQHLAAASSAGTSLEANLKHITVTLATWDAVWEVYLDPKWARQRLRLYGAQDQALEQFFNKLEEGMEELSMKRHGCAKQLVVFFGAASIGTAGGWGANAVLRACRKVVCRPRGKDQDGGRVVLVDEHRTSRVSSAVNGKQPCEVELNTLSATRPAGWRPPAGQVHHRLVRPAWSQERGQPVRGLVWCPVVAPRRPPQAPRSGQAATQAAASEPGPSTPQPAKRSKRTKAEPGAAEPTKGKGKPAKAKPAPQPGRWLDRDCNAALNMQRIWGEQGALPAKGKEYPGLGYKRLRDKPPKAQEQQQQPAEAHICDGLTMLFSMAKKKRRTVPRPVPEDPDSDIEDRDEALQPDLTEAQRNKKASGEARAARDRDNTYHARKAKLAHLIDHLPQELWDAFLADAVQPRVEAISERGVLASLLLGLLVRGLFTIRVADPLGLHDQPVYTDIPVSQAAIPDLSCRNLFLQLCRGPPGNGANTQPNAAVAAVLAAHPDLRARLAAIPRHLSDSNMVDHVGKQLETAFSNILTLLFAGRLKKSVSLAGAKVLLGTEEHRRRFGFWGVEGGGHLPAWSKRECTYVRRMVCGLDVSWLVGEGGVVPTPAMQAEVALQRGLLGLEEGERVDDDWVEDPVNRGRLLRHAVHTTREMEAAMAAWQLDMAGQARSGCTCVTRPCCVSGGASGGNSQLQQDNPRKQICACRRQRMVCFVPSGPTSLLCIREVGWLHEDSDELVFQWHSPTHIQHRAAALSSLTLSVSSCRLPANAHSELTLLPVGTHRGRNPGTTAMRYVWDGSRVTAMDESLLTQMTTASGRVTQWASGLLDRLQRAFLPDSKEVTPDYWEWLRWRLTQRFFSSTMQNLSTQSLLLALGMGAKRSIAAGAAINWLLKDGVGRVARMAVATNFGQSFDSDLKARFSCSGYCGAAQCRPQAQQRVGWLKTGRCQRIRFKTSLIFEATIGCEFITPFFPQPMLLVLPLPLLLLLLLQHFLLLASVANVGKAIALAAFVATAPAFQQSLCNGGNLADLTAKNQAQHMVVDMLALAVSAGAMWWAKNLKTPALLPLLAFPLLASGDLYSIYRELKSVQLYTLNRERAEIIAAAWLSERRVPLAAEARCRPGPGGRGRAAAAVSQQERLLFPSSNGHALPLRIQPLSQLLPSPEALGPLLQQYADSKYLLLVKTPQTCSPNHHTSAPPLPHPSLNTPPAHQPNRRSSQRQTASASHSGQPLLTDSGQGQQGAGQPALLPPLAAPQLGGWLRSTRQPEPHIAVSLSSV